MKISQLLFQIMFERYGVAAYSVPWGKEPVGPQYPTYILRYFPKTLAEHHHHPPTRLNCVTTQRCHSEDNTTFLILSYKETQGQRLPQLVRFWRPQQFCCRVLWHWWSPQSGQWDCHEPAGCGIWDEGGDWQVVAEGQAEVLPHH